MGGGFGRSGRGQKDRGLCCARESGQREGPAKYVC
ncbi:uncharacterized protein HMPREF1541_05220 [Cyphellophora europaea CBS 101466]|uniref:Uncharacterized protein n=1 Tax=Cyphellophora europaea (strain CBS 101466) TaxID=1220924 RepID=W2RXA7_CYPE1|nr:uncharacterized protein HMPREF1541_05220 [Cyphellophora europaea CBS 101466]ETN40940.1 hypothetical protein HMPREF1541_05220 [Cyphellophora europaea CBS 101466]